MPDWRRRTGTASRSPRRTRRRRSASSAHSRRHRGDRVDPGHAAGLQPDLPPDITVTPRRDDRPAGRRHDVRRGRDHAEPAHPRRLVQPSGDLARAFQWLRCNGSGTDCNEIAGANGRTYTLAARRRHAHDARGRHRRHDRIGAADLRPLLRRRVRPGRDRPAAPTRHARRGSAVAGPGAERRGLRRRDARGLRGRLGRSDDRLPAPLGALRRRAAGRAPTSRRSRAPTPRTARPTGSGRTTWATRCGCG